MLNRDRMIFAIDVQPRSYGLLQWIGSLRVWFVCASLVFVPVHAGVLWYDDDMLGRWRLSREVSDSSGRGNHGRNHGAELTASGPKGEPSTAARFDGKTSWIEVPANSSLGVGVHDFSVAAWVHVSGDDELDDGYGDIVSQYDPETRRGFSLSITHNSGVTSNQSNTRNVHFGIDNGQLDAEWTDHGQVGDAVLVFALAVHDGNLFAGTCEPGRAAAGHVYRFDGDSKWIDCGSPDRCNSVSSLAVFDGQLYAAVSKYRLAGSALAESENPNLGGRVYRYAGDRRWVDCGQLPDAEAIGGLVVFRGKLYASSLYKPAGFFRYDGGANWTALPTPGGKRVEAMCVFNGELFASSYDEAHVYRYDGTTWRDCGQVGPAENTQTYSFAVHEGRLFVGTWRTGRVFRYRGDNDWEDTGRLGEELEVMGMLVHNGKLYAGTLPQAEVYRFDGPERWTRVGRLDHTPDVKYRRAWTMAEFQGRLYCGTLPSGRVLSIEAGRNVTYDRTLAAGWHHIAAVKRGAILSLFVDGKPVATSRRFEVNDYQLSNAQPLRIGFGPHDYFRGSMSDVRLYNRAVDDREVLE
jgi:hypothetical protein